MSRDALLFLEDIERSCAKVLRYSLGCTKEQFASDEIKLDAILLNLQVIGEAVKRIPPDLRNRYPEIAWREAAGLRDFISHAYFSLDLEIIWDAIQNDIPGLLEAVKKVLKAERAAGA